MSRDPAAGLGPVQRYVLLILADGQARTVDRIETDALMTPGRAYGALDGLARRGLVERRYELHERGASYYLSEKGQEVANRIHHLTDEQEDTRPRCPHGTPEGEPCKECRVGPWRCPDCGELVRGGQRAPHRRETHGETTYRPGRIAWTWAGSDPAAAIQD
jgi:DNA-binding MarR family transcriptional regulator